MSTYTVRSGTQIGVAVLGAGRMAQTHLRTPPEPPRARAGAGVGAGRAVWSEKPIALDLAETGRVVALAEASGIPVQLGFMRRFDPGYVRAKEGVESGALGRLETFRALSRDTY